MQRKAITFLSLAQMWKFFSHFGVRTLLVLFLVEKLGYSDSRAFGINAVFCGLTELGGIFGGMLADRYLGLKRGMVIGSLLLAAGYLSMIFEPTLFLAMGLIIAGCSFFSSTITALLGLAYSENDPNRKKGFTIFYMMQNLGALVSTILCGFVASRYGFKPAFAVASLGMILGSFMLLFCGQNFSLIDEKPKEKKAAFPAMLGCALIATGTLGVYFEQVFFWLLPWLTGGILLFFFLRLLKDKRWQKEQIFTLFLYLCGLILFFAVEDQICSSLLLFAERETNRTFFGWTIPSSFITSLNPIVILLLGALIAKMKPQLLTPFAITGCAFGLLATLCLAGFSCSIFGVMGMVVVISIAELMVGPLVLSTTSEIASKGSPGMIMGMVPIAFSLAFQFSGGIGKLVAIEDQNLTLHTYGVGFGIVAVLLLAGGTAIKVLMKVSTREKAIFNPE